MACVVYLLILNTYVTPVNLSLVALMTLFVVLDLTISNTADQIYELKSDWSGSQIRIWGGLFWHRAIRLLKLMALTMLLAANRNRIASF